MTQLSYNFNPKNVKDGIIYGIVAVLSVAVIAIVIISTVTI